MGTSGSGRPKDRQIAKNYGKGEQAQHWKNEAKFHVD